MAHVDESIGRKIDVHSYYIVASGSVRKVLYHGEILEAAHG
jgi:hypothetical protein